MKYLSGKITACSSLTLLLKKNILMIRLSVVLFLLTLTARAQFHYRLDTAVNVEEEGAINLRSPWSGGLNSAEYSTMDLNNDSKSDLVIYDRMAQKVITFLNANSKYVYAPHYESFFPENLLNWMLLRDYNGDGKKDLFTGDLFGIRVFTNISSGNTPEWKHFRFYVSPTAFSDALLSQGLSGLVNVQLQFDDMPSISDVDGDGDLDIFCMKFGTSGTIEFHKNLSVETYGTADSLKFKLQTQAWGNVRECGCAEMSFNGGPCKSPGPGKENHAGGKSLLAIDFNGNSVVDLLFSEGECSTLYALENEGSLDAAVVTDFFAFPQASPASFPQYPAGYFEDVDFDGVKDLIVTPNLLAKELYQTNFSHSNWFYKNTGTNTSPVFVFSKTNLLQEEMIDLGDNAVPAFADADADGDYDLFVSSNNLPATIRVYENIGTSTRPEFRFKVDDFMGLSNQFYRNMKIQFADINGDGKSDIVFTATAFQSGVTNLYYVANKNFTTYDFSGQPIVQVPFILSGSENAFIADVDGDGKQDVLKGKSNGALEFWRNTGALNLELANAEYLGLGANVDHANQTIRVGDLNVDGKPELILSDQSGRLRIINDYANASDGNNPVTDVVLDEISSEYYSPNLGGRIWPVVVNLFGETRPAIVVGTALGGLRLLRGASGNDEDEVSIQVFPNPQQKGNGVKIIVSHPASVTMYSIKGQRIPFDASLIPNQETYVPLFHLAAGVYIIQFEIGNKNYTRKLVVY
jgi:hypothetical protein